MSSSTYLGEYLGELPRWVPEDMYMQHLDHVALHYNTLLCLTLQCITWYYTILC